MLMWMCGVTKKDKMRNEHVRRSVKVAPVMKEMTEKRTILGNRQRGSQKTRLVKQRYRSLGLKVEGQNGQEKVEYRNPNNSGDPR